MPTYDYACEACQHRFEEFQSITAKALKKCPKCGRPKLRRLIGTGGGLLFKGSGFYITDYRSSSYKEKAKADSGGSPGGASGDAGKGGGSTKEGSGGAKPADGGSSSAAKNPPKKASGDS